MSWFHVEGINDEVMRNMCELLKLQGPGLSHTGHPSKSIKSRQGAGAQVAVESKV